MMSHPIVSSCLALFKSGLMRLRYVSVPQREDRQDERRHHKERQQQRKDSQIKNASSGRGGVRSVFRLSFGEVAALDNMSSLGTITLPARHLDKRSGSGG